MVSYLFVVHLRVPTFIVRCACTLTCKDTISGKEPRIQNVIAKILKQVVKNSQLLLTVKKLFVFWCSIGPQFALKEKKFKTIFANDIRISYLSHHIKIVCFDNDGVKAFLKVISLILKVAMTMVCI